MAKEEILTGLRNGLARGESIQDAIRALTSAGYNAEDINEAANSLNTGVLSRMPLPQSLPSIKEIQNAVQPRTPQTMNQTQQPLNQNNQQQTQTPQIEKKKIPKWIIITLITLAVFLVSLGVFMLFGEKILDMIL